MSQMRIHLALYVVPQGWPMADIAGKIQEQGKPVTMLLYPLVMSYTTASVFVFIGCLIV